MLLEAYACWWEYRCSLIQCYNSLIPFAEPHAMPAILLGCLCQCKSCVRLPSSLAQQICNRPLTYSTVSWLCLTACFKVNVRPFQSHRFSNYHSCHKQQPERSKKVMLVVIALVELGDYFLKFL